MKKDRGFYEYVVNDVFDGIDGISSRAMFGGWGIYRDGIFFALIDDGKLYFKAGESNLPDFEAAGCKPFVYFAKEKKMTMSYWNVPEDILESKTELKIWIEKAVEESIKSKKR